MTTDDKTRIELEAAVFRRLVDHLRSRTDVQNIDMMDLAGFCRNCLASWMFSEADAMGLDMTRDACREAVYGMPYAEWKSQTPARGDARAGRRVGKTGAQALKPRACVASQSAQDTAIATPTVFDRSIRRVPFAGQSKWPTTDGDRASAKPWLHPPAHITSDLLTIQPSVQ